MGETMLLLHCISECFICESDQYTSIQGNSQLLLIRMAASGGQ